MRIELVDLKRQYNLIRDELDQAIASCVLDTRFIGGDPVNQFGQEFASFCEAAYCAPCANGTDALEIALQALGIGQGDEVIVPAFTFFATVEAVLSVGATPVLCDISQTRYAIDPDLVEAKITPKTKAIIAVHLYGQMAEMDPLCKLALKYQLKIIEDAAQAHGASYKGRRAGSIGDIATFSFYPGKNLGAFGDAGAVTTNDEAYFKNVQMIANHGRLSKYDHLIPGRNSRMDSIQAAVLNVKLKYLHEWNEKRRIVADQYRQLLSSTSKIVLPVEFPDSLSVYHLFVIRVQADVRDDLLQHLKEKNINAGIHYPISMPKLKALQSLNLDQSEFLIANRMMNEVISLPIFPELTKEEVSYISDTLLEYLK